MNKRAHIYFLGRRKNRPSISRPAFARVVQHLSEEYNTKIDVLRYVFMGDDELLNINIQYLSHDTYTDIITFDLTEKDGVEGEIYISLDRVAENAGVFKTTFKEEFLRVLFHGVLHLLGHKDKNTKDRNKMRQAEMDCINLYLELETSL